MNRISREKWYEILTLLLEGHSQRHTAELVGCAKGTIALFLHEWELVVGEKLMVTRHIYGCVPSKPARACRLKE